MPASTKRRITSAVRWAAASGFAPAPDNGFTIAKTSIAWAAGRNVIVVAPHAAAGGFMTRLSVRIALVIVCLAASVSAAFLIWTSEQQARAQLDSSRQFSSTALAARIAASELRGAQQGYVAAGQGPDFWFARVTAIARDLRTDLASLKSLASSPDASIAIEDATGALQDFEQMDRRARDFTRARQLNSASDLIFADGFDLTKKAADDVDRALSAELGDRNGVLSFLKHREGYALAGGSTVIALVVLLLLPVPRRAVAEARIVAAPAPIATVSDETLE